MSSIQRRARLSLVHVHGLRLHLCLAAVACVLAAFPPAIVHGFATSLEENQIKAAFLYNFAKFVQWPASDRGPLVIGVVGDEALSDLVERVVHGRSVHGRQLATRRLAVSDDSSGCSMVFVPGSRPRDAADVLQRTRGAVLTIGETVQFIRDGGMVRFFIENNHLRFQINQKNAEAAGLKISSQLLTLAAH